jgi:hypothetical protein
MPSRNKCVQAYTQLPSCRLWHDNQMNDPNKWLFAVMLLAGLVGGDLNYLRSRNEDAKSADAWQSLLGGVIASFLVPLFLNMISSSLLDTIWCW